MRISRSRLFVRIGILAAGGGFMLWKAWEAQAAARGMGPGLAGQRLLAERIALVEGLVGLLALLLAAGLTFTLRRKPPKRTLTLPRSDPR